MDLLKQDKALKQYKIDYGKQKVSMIDEIVDITNRFDYDTLNKYTKDLDRFKRETTKALKMNILTPYQRYNARRWLIARRMRNRDLLLWYLIYEYAYFNYATKELEKRVFNEVNKMFVEETEAQCRRITGKDYKMNYKVLTNKALKEPNNLGYIWDTYKDTTVDFNANEMYNEIVVGLKQDKRPLIDEVVTRQENRIVKKNLLGALDNEIDFITSYSQLQIFNKYGINKVRVMGILDEKTCEVCDEYIGKEFKTEDIVIGEQISSHISCRCWLDPIR